MPIERFAPHRATNREFAAFAALLNRIRAEELPDDPPIPVAEYVRRLQNVSPAVDMTIWAAWNVDRSAIIATSSVQYTPLEDRESVSFRINVLPEFRQQGIGSQLLALVANVARRAERPMLQAHTSGRIAAGEAFMMRLGAVKGLESRVNQLDLVELDLEVFRGLIDDAARRADEFDLLFWTGPYPEEHIEAIAELHNVINHQPRGTLEAKDIHFTPDHVRVIEHQAFANGAERWSLYAKEKTTGKFAGFTQVYWHPNRPTLLQQSFTGVFPEYRNRGLGRWLKIAMLEKVITQRSHIRFVRTDNANSNAAILRINTLLGFKNYSASTTWQVELSKVTEYLNRIPEITLRAS